MAAHGEAEDLDDPHSLSTVSDDTSEFSSSVATEAGGQLDKYNVFFFSTKMSEFGTNLSYTAATLVLVNTCR